jgi:hypothetical protein
MLNYAETASRSTNVPLTTIPCGLLQERSTTLLPDVIQPQGQPDWTISGDFGDWRYKGMSGEVRIPGTIWMYCDASFAQGFQRGRELMLERQDGEWYILTDQEFTALIAQSLPAGLPAAAIAPWKRGFIFGWCMTWHYQPFLDEEAEAAKLEETPAAPVAPRKRCKTSAPKYPNALRSCIKQAGYTFREVSQETGIPESTLYSWAAGKGVILHESRKQLADVIGCSVEELVPKLLTV